MSCCWSMSCWRADLLFGAALEDEDDAAERCRVGEGALVELGAGERMGVAGEGGDAGVVYGLEDAGAGCGKLRLRGRRGETAKRRATDRQKQAAEL